MAKAGKKPAELVTTGFEGGETTQVVAEGEADTMPPMPVDEDVDPGAPDPVEPLVPVPEFGADIVPTEDFNFGFNGVVISFRQFKKVHVEAQLLRDLRLNGMPFTEIEVK